MNLDEAIKHAEEMMEEYKKKLKVYESIDKDRPLFTEEEMECRLYAEEHEQLTKWLKELRTFKEKAEPQIVYYINDGRLEDDADAYCPNCNELLNDYWNCDYCPCCGQALEW
jgi:hypothetical protein